MPRLKALVLSLATLCAPAAIAQNANPAVPGTINYVEGSASIDGRTLNQRSVGYAQLSTGHVLQTAAGRVEILLTPGVFLRLGENSAVRMVSPSLLNTQVALMQGQADVEVDEIRAANDLQVVVGNSSTRLLKNGFYAFDAGRQSVRVFKGEAALQTGAADGQKPLKIKSGHEVTQPSNATMKPVGFSTNQSEDALFQWSSLRSSYLAEANMNMASSYADYGPVSAGWYWDAGFYGYTWLPGDGLLFSPFGWGFYSPRYIFYGGPIYGRGGYGRGGYGRGYAPTRSAGAFHEGGFGGGGHAMGGGGHGGRG